MEQTSIALERASRGGLDTDDAYAQALPAISAVPSQQLVTINVDIMTVITTVLGALPKLRGLQGRMEALWTDFDAEKYERLERHALALQQAHAVYQTTRARHPSLAPLADELVKVRDRLLGNALSLARYGLMDRRPLQAIQHKGGYRPLAGDVGVLVAVYREHWSSLSGKTPVTLAELDHAAALALRLLVAVGAREHTPPAFARAARVRQQAFTLLAEEYADVRNDLRYLLGKKSDVEAVAPSLYAGRGRKRVGGAKAWDRQAGWTAGIEGRRRCVEGHCNLAPLSEGLRPPAHSLSVPARMQHWASADRRAHSAYAATSTRPVAAAVVTLGGPAIIDEQRLGSQRFAERLGFSRTHLSDLEHGRRSVSPERSAQFASALGQHQAQFVRLALQDPVREVGLKLRVDVHAA